MEGGSHLIATAVSALDSIQMGQQGKSAVKIAETALGYLQNTDPIRVHLHSHAHETLQSTQLTILFHANLLDQLHCLTYPFISSNGLSILSEVFRAEQSS
jgi:hypothetical protein